MNRFIPVALAILFAAAALPAAAQSLEKVDSVITGWQGLIGRYTEMIEKAN